MLTDVKCYELSQCWFCSFFPFFLLPLSFLASSSTHCCPSAHPRGQAAACWTVLRMPMASTLQHLHLCRGPVCLGRSRPQGKAWQLVAPSSTVVRWAMWIHVPASLPIHKTILKCASHHLPEASTGIEP